MMRPRERCLYVGWIAGEDVLEVSGRIEERPSRLGRHGHAALRRLSAERTCDGGTDFFGQTQRERSPRQGLRVRL
jgi:hypothetical protein